MFVDPFNSRMQVNNADCLKSFLTWLLCNTSYRKPQYIHSNKQLLMSFHLLSTLGPRNGGAVNKMYIVLALFSPNGNTTETQRSHYSNNFIFFTLLTFLKPFPPARLELTTQFLNFRHLCTNMKGQPNFSIFNLCFQSPLFTQGRAWATKPTYKCRDKKSSQAYQ